MPSPYYQDSAVTIYHGDCREIAPTLGRFDLLLTDPPYGISHPCDFKKRGRGKLAQCNDFPDVHDDNKPFDPSEWLSFDKVVFWGANYFADKLPPVSGWLVWDKERPDALDQATCELAWTNCVKGVRRFKHLWNGMMKASEHGESYHPTQKPVALMKWVMSLPWIADAQTILDPFAGSGTTGRAAKDLGRKCTLIEREEKYCEIAAKRMAQEVFQL